MTVRDINSKVIRHQELRIFVFYKCQNKKQLLHLIRVKSCKKANKRNIAANDINENWWTE